MLRRGRASRPVRPVELPVLVTAARSGDPAAAGELVRRFQDMAYATAFAHLGDHHRAEDAAQDAFMTALQRLPDLREPAAFPGWFRQIVRGACGRLTRGPAPSPLALDAAAALEDAGPAPERLAESRELAGRVRQALATLPEAQRLATVLYYLGDYSQAEVAAYLGVPVTTVKKRLYAARQRLRERMLDMVEGELRAHRPSRAARFAGSVALVAAVKRGDAATAGALLDADPTLLSARDGTMPLLQVAAMYGYNGRGRSHQAVVDLLLDRGAPLDLAAAAYLDDPARAAALLDAAPDAAAAVQEADAEGLTALHFAAERGATAVARLLLDAGADPDAVDAYGCPPLLCAGHAGPWKAAPALDLVDLLVARGARVDVFRAAALGDVPRLRALLDADPALVRATDAAGRTALYHAAHDLKLEAVDLLLNRGADVNARFPDGQTAVGTAITHSWDEAGPAVVARLRAAGAALDLIDACIVGDVDRVRSQIAAHLEQLRARRSGETALHVAARWNRPDVAALLLEAGLDVNLPADDEATPVDAAASWGRTAMVDWLTARGGVPAAR